MAIVVDTESGVLLQAVFVEGECNGGVRVATHGESKTEHDNGSAHGDSCDGFEALAETSEIVTGAM